MEKAKQLLQEVKDENTMLAVNGGHGGFWDFVKETVRDVVQDPFVDKLVEKSATMIRGLEHFDAVSALPLGTKSHSTNTGHAWCTYR